MAAPIIETKIDQVIDREDWLEARRSGIGGSDVAALFGVHPWMSPYTLFLDKLGHLPKRDDDAILQVGHELEPLTRRLFMEETGRRVVDAQERFSHPEHRHMLATIDGSIDTCDAGDGLGVFEGKTTNPYSKDSWLDGAPLYYVLQIMHYMIVTGRSWGSIAVIVLGEREPLMWSDVDLDVELAEMIVEAESRFWNHHVLARVPPDIDGHPSTTKAIRDMHPNDSGLMIEMDDEAVTWRDELEITKGTIKELNARKSELENRVRSAMQDACYAVLPDGTGWSLRTSHVKEHVVKSRTQRALRSISRRAIDKAKREADRALDRMRIR